MLSVFLSYIIVIGLSLEVIPTEFTTGQLAKMLGLTNEGVRYMERMGIVHPRRDETSGYRWFSYDDYVRLRRTKIFRKLGFSLEEVLCVLDGELSLPETKTLYSRKLEEIQEQKRELELVEQNLFAQSKTLEMLDAGEQAYRFVRPDPMVFCPKRRNGKSIQYDKDTLAANSLWADPAHLANMLAIYYRNGEQTKGLAVSEENFKRLDLPRKKNLQYIRLGLCANGAIEVPMFGWFDFKSLMRWIRSQGREPIGDVYCIMRVSVRSDDGQIKSINEFFAPIQEKSVDYQVT